MADDTRPNITLTWEEARMILGALALGTDLTAAHGTPEQEIEAFEALAVLTERVYGGYLPDQGDER